MNTKQPQCERCKKFVSMPKDDFDALPRYDWGVVLCEDCASSQEIPLAVQ